MNERIKKIRLAFKLTQAEFAESIGYSRSSIAFAESNAHSVSQNIVDEICRVYGINEVWLRTGIGDWFLAESEEQGFSTWIVKILSESFTANQYSEYILNTYLRLSQSEQQIVRSFIHSVYEEGEKYKNIGQKASVKADKIEQ